LPSGTLLSDVLPRAMDALTPDGKVPPKA